VAKFEALAAEIQAATGKAMTPVEIAEGFVTIAVENMAKAVRQISIQRGYDVTKYVLACFGGAGGQHACLVADALGMTEVMIHPFAGVLSAYGMGLADLRTLREATVERPLAEAAADLAIQPPPWRRGGGGAVGPERAAGPRRNVASLLVKYAGTDTPLRVPLGDAAAVREAFETLHQRRFGFVSPSTALVVEALAVEAIGHADAGEAPDLGFGAESKPEPLAILATRMAGAEHATPVFDRAALPIGGEVPGRPSSARTPAPR
jgi:5-oxoprolinase (ATP-hydrolysing)